MLTQKQLKILENIVNLGRKCDQFLYTQKQAEHYMEGATTALQSLQSEVKISGQPCSHISLIY